eukprot:scpid65248/ scgid31254/ 
MMLPGSSRLLLMDSQWTACWIALGMVVIGRLHSVEGYLLVSTKMATNSCFRTLPADTQRGDHRKLGALLIRVSILLDGQPIKEKKLNSASASIGSCAAWARR